jgi:hypothetical protein
LRTRNDFGQVNTQGGSDPQQRVQTWTLNFLFDVANRLPGNAGFFGKHFKRKATLFTLLFQNNCHLRTDGSGKFIVRHTEAIPKKEVDMGCQNSYIVSSFMKTGLRRAGPFQPNHPKEWRHEKFAMPCRIRRKAHSNRNARLISNEQGSASSENIRLLQGSGSIAHWCQFFQPEFPVLISGQPGLRQCFSRTVSDMESFWVCALASPNRVEKSCRTTRGFTSCCHCSTITEQCSDGPFNLGGERQERL